MRSAIRATCALLCALASLSPAVAQDQSNAPAASPSATVAPVAEPAPAAPVVATPAPTTTPAAVAPAPVAAAPAASPVAAAVVEQAAKLQRAKSVDKGDLAAIATYYAVAEIQPVWTGAQGFTAKATAAMREIAAADDWGLKASDYELPAALPAGADTAAMAEAELKLALAVLEYARHARGGRMDPTDLSFNIDRKPSLLDPLKVLADAASAGEVDGYLRKLHPQHPQFELLRQKYLEAKRAPVAAPAAAPVEASPQAKSKTAKQPKPAREEAKLATRILYNMEMWRWMPEDLGAVYVNSNIPEFMMRVVKSGKVIHEERIITGKVENQTPIFSEMMEHIVFHPFWGVPDSIKVKEIWPSLAGGGSVLERHGLRIQKGGRDIDPSSVNWSSTDIRQFHVYQPPGGSNVLGVVKFMFPNKHQVYMHDTPTKDLFNSTQRTFSHGCMRVRNPVRLAEVLLENDKGWDAGRVGALAKGGPQNNHVYMDKKIPVHVTYFTAVVGADGNLKMFPDVYGHEPKIQMGLDGKAHLIVKKKPSLTPPDVVTRLAETKQSGPLASWMKNFFGGF